MGKHKTILSVYNLSVGYKPKQGQHVILKNINLQLQTGKLVCFMGPNGVGKSTLIRTLCQAQPALSGKIMLDQQGLDTYSANKLAAQISVVLTDKVNAAGMSVHDMVALGRYPYIGWNVQFSKADTNQIEKAIELTGVGYLRDRKLYELSDGQMQKVMIARAVCQDTPIMILDEPTAHLDLNNRVEMINLLKSLAVKTNKAILMATHELDLALQSADRIWLAGQNQQVVDGFPEDLVLDGSLDNVFGLKGFDLKTGRLIKSYPKGKVTLKGTGHLYLWTKNALERNGFEVVNEAPIKISIEEAESIQWNIKNKGEYSVSTLEQLIKLIS